MHILCKRIAGRYKTQKRGISIRNDGMGKRAGGTGHDYIFLFVFRASVCAVCRFVFGRNLCCAKKQSRNLLSGDRIIRVHTIIYTRMYVLPTGIIVCDSGRTVYRVYYTHARYTHYCKHARPPATCAGVNVGR